ncbi:MAG: hypothetical protein IJN15_01305 [Clostridia bacterium]|nr:hypothetical protein [Clostridia bacterium]
MANLTSLLRSKNFTMSEADNFTLGICPKLHSSPKGEIYEGFTIAHQS